MDGRAGSPRADEIDVALCPVDLQARFHLELAFQLCRPVSEAVDRNPDSCVEADRGSHSLEVVTDGHYAKLIDRQRWVENVLILPTIGQGLRLNDFAECVAGGGVNFKPVE